MASHAIRRLTKELKQLEAQANQQLVVKPSPNDLLIWHFVLHSLPADTVFKGGCYHGKIAFPEDYPHAPPSLMMLTPNGRLETNRRLCLSMTDYHPESWNPAWSIESILVGLMSFMIDTSEPNGLGVVRETAEKRQRLASASWEYNLKDPDFRMFFPEFVHRELSWKQRQPSPLLASEDDPISQESLLIKEIDEEAIDEGIARPLGEALKEPSPLPGHALGHAAPDEILDLSGLGVRAPEPRTGTSSDTDEEARPECWICREDGSQEPLIQPCACRGSMSGVHASCVEQWIRHHRSNAVRQETPRCSVCGEMYIGSEKRPGPLGFARHLCSDFARQAGRSTILVGLLVAYWAAAQPTVVRKKWLRLVLLTLSSAFFCYKTMILLVSLPRGQPRPHNFLRVFHVGDFRLLAVHIAEAMATVVIAGLWCAYGQLKYTYFLPLCLLVVLPLINILLRHEGTPCSMRSVMVVLLIVGSPFIVMAHLGKLVWQHPKRLVDPLDGVVHVFVPVVAIPFCWLCSSSTPVLVLWGAHSIVLMLSVLEKSLVKRFHWKEGRIWWIVLQLSVLSAYIGNLLHSSNSEEDFGHDEQLLILGVSLFWLGLVGSLVFQVNWMLCVEQYRAWQQRNGSFSLQGAMRAQTIGSQPHLEADSALGVVPQGSSIAREDV